MYKKLALIVISLVLVLGMGTAAGAAGKLMVIALSAPELMESYMVNAGLAADEYDIIDTKDELSTAWENRAQYAAIVFAYHEMQNSFVTSQFIVDHQDEYVAYVKDGGGVFSTVRDDPADKPLIEPFQVKYSGAGSYNTTIFDVAQEHPIFAGLDLKKLDQQISGTADPSFVDSGLSTENPDIKVIATMPGTDLPAIVAGSVGKGRVVFAGAELFWQDYVELSEHLKLVKNVLDWIRGK